MKRLRLLPLFLAATVVPLFPSPLSAATDPSEQFLNAYQSYEQGERMERSGGTQEALSKYRFAESLLVTIARDNPSWQKPVVDYRLKKTREALDRLQGGSGVPGTDGTITDQSPLPADSPAQEIRSDRPAPVPPSGGPSITIVPPGASSSPALGKGGSGSGASAELRALRRRISELTEQLAQARDALGAQKTRSSDLAGAQWASERTKLQNELNAANTRISDLQHDLNARASWANDLKAIQKKLDDAVADREVAEEQSREASRKSAAEREVLLRDLATAREGAKHAEDLSPKVAELSAQGDALKAELARLKSSLDEATAAGRKAEEQRAAMEKRAGEAERMLAEAERREQQLMPLREKVVLMESEERTLRGTLDETRRKAEVSLRNEADLKTRLKAGEAERKRLSESVGKLAETVAKTAGEHPGPEVNPLVTDVDGLRKSLAEAEEGYASALEGMRVNDAEIAGLRTKHESEVDPMYADLAVLGEEKNRLAARKASLSLPANADAEGAVAAAEARISRSLDELSRQASELRSGIDRRAADFVTKRRLLEAKALDTSKRITELEARCTDVRTKLADDLGKLEGLLAGNAPLLRQEVAGLSARLKENGRLAEESRKRIAKLQSEADARESALKARVMELDRSRDESSKLRSRLEASDKELAALKSARKEDSAKPSLADAGKLRDLQGRLEEREAEIKRLRSRPGIAADLEKSEEENRLLKEIVGQQLRAQVRRSEARRLVDDELAKLHVRSEILSAQIGILSEPVVPMTPEVKVLFKGALDTPPADSVPPQKIEASVSAPMKRPDAVPSGGASPDGGAAVSPSPSPVPSTSPVPGSSDTPTATNAAPSPAVSTNPPAPTAAVSPSSSPEEIPWEGKFKEYLARAKSQFDSQNYQAAESTFREALKLSPDDYFALSNLGVVEFQLGKLADAEEVLRKASEHSKEGSSFALTTLGIVHYRQNRLEDAAKVLRQAIGVNDHDYTAHNYLGIVLAAMGKGKSGESEIMRAIEINPKYADAHFNLAVIYATGKPPARMMAQKHYTKAIELGSPRDSSLEKLMQ